VRTGQLFVVLIALWPTQPKFWVGHVRVIPKRLSGTFSSFADCTLSMTLFHAVKYG